MIDIDSLTDVVKPLVDFSKALINYNSLPHKAEVLYWMRKYAHMAGAKYWLTGDQVLALSCDISELVLPLLDEIGVCNYRESIDALRRYLAGVGSLQDILPQAPAADIRVQQRIDNDKAVASAVMAVTATVYAAYSGELISVALGSEYAMDAIDASTGNGALKVQRLIDEKALDMFTWDDVPTIPDKVYIRFGRWSDPSFNWGTGKPEKGVSVFNATLDPESLIVRLGPVSDPLLLNLRQERMAYAVTGTVAGTKHSGEVLLHNVKALPYAIDYRSMAHTTEHDSPRRAYKRPSVESAANALWAANRAA